jgi:hypothetical protein
MITKNIPGFAVLIITLWTVSSYGGSVKDSGCVSEECQRCREIEKIIVNPSVSLSAADDWYYTIHYCKKYQTSMNDPFYTRTTASDASVARINFHSAPPQYTPIQSHGIHHMAWGIFYLTGGVAGGIAIISAASKNKWDKNLNWPCFWSLCGVGVTITYGITEISTGSKLLRVTNK